MPCRSRWTGIGKLLRQRYQLWDPNECASPQDHLIRTTRANDKVWVTWPYRITFLWKKYTVLDTFFKGKLSWYTHGGLHCWHFFSPENASFLAVMLTACHRPLPCSQITISYCADFPDRHWLFRGQWLTKCPFKLLYNIYKIFWSVFSKLLNTQIKYIY